MIIPSQVLALQVSGYIGVAISVIAMTATIFVFLFLECKITSKKKPLLTMRNYVHVQLCMTLSIAQIIFVAGIEPHLDEGHIVGRVEYQLVVDWWLFSSTTGSWSPSCGC